MKALQLHNSRIFYKPDLEIPKLTSHLNVLVKVHYAGICKTDLGIAKSIVPANDPAVLGHEFCGEIVAFRNDQNSMDGWSVGDAVSANPMAFGGPADTMCGKDCDGAYAEYIAVPDKALVRLSPELLSPLGAFLEPVAAALAPLKYINGRCCIFGGSRIAELSHQVARRMGYQDIERVSRLEDLQKEHYDCLIETEPKHIDAYIEALKPGGTLILKSRSFSPTSFTANAIAMKEIRIQGARYGDFAMASRILSATANHEPYALDTDSLFGNVYELAKFETAFTEAEQPGSKKTFFKICAES